MADADKHNLLWEHRQQELWDRIFQATQDVAELAEGLDESAGNSVIREEMVRAAMNVGKELVRATAANSGSAFEAGIEAARMAAVETDYWLRMMYVMQQEEGMQRDLSNIITQYGTIVDLLEKVNGHVRQTRDAAKHTRGPKVNLG